MHHAALEAVRPVVVAVVAVEHDDRIPELALALERREHGSDRVVGDGTRTRDLVGQALANGAKARLCSMCVIRSQT